MSLSAIKNHKKNHIAFKYQCYMTVTILLFIITAEISF